MKTIISAIKAHGSTIADWCREQNRRLVLKHAEAIITERHQPCEWYVDNNDMGGITHTWTWNTGTSALSIVCEAGPDATLVTNGIVNIVTCREQLRIERGGRSMQVFGRGGYYHLSYPLSATADERASCPDTIHGLLGIIRCSQRSPIAAGGPYQS